MTMTTETPHGDVSGKRRSWASYLVTPLRLLKRMIERYHHRKAVETLRLLDDYILRDIGLKRADIPFAVRNGRRPDH